MTPRLQWLTWPALLAVDQLPSDSLGGVPAPYDSGLRWLLENDADCEPDLWARGLSATNSIGHLCRAFPREAVASVALCSG